MIPKFFELQYAEAARDFIQKNFNRKITVQDIAEHVGIGEKTLQRVFKRQYQKGIQEYQVEVRMEKAKEHLESGRKTIKQVAYLIGYKRQSSFSKRFQRVFGKCPMEYMQGGGS